MTTADSDRARRRHARDRRRREIITPEGVALPVQLADRGERAVAVILDLAIIIGAIVALVLLTAFAFMGGDMSDWALGFVLLFSFALRSFYFVFFELRWQGSTPGKRAVGIRVIDRAGGALRADAVLARNLMREVEIFIPLSLLGTAGFADGGDQWIVLFTLVWVGIFLLMPLFNKDCMRVGDIVGGTWVIAAPMSVLLPDMARTNSSPLRRGPAGPAYAFTPEQLDIYGIYELQTLEEVLRDQGPNADTTCREVCERIWRKIDWPNSEPVDHPRKFLEAFYAALRARLEGKMLFGVRREDKHDKR